MLGFANMPWHILCIAAGRTSGGMSDVLRSADD